MTFISRRKPALVALTGLFLVFSCGDLLGQNNYQKQLVRNIIEHSEARANLLNNLSYTVTQIRIKDGVEQRRATSRTDNLKKNVWRKSFADKEKGEAVVARNRDFNFTAGGKKGEFDFGNAQYGKKKNEIAPSHDGVFGMPLHEFVQKPKMTLTPLDSMPPQNGRRVEGVSYEWVDTGMVTRGELHWLPDHHYVLTKNYGVASFDESGPDQVLVNKTIEYGAFDNRVIPVRYTATGNNNQTVHEMSDFSTANSDPEFYTPESLGLETPRRPESSRWWIWAIAGLLCLAGAVWFHKHNRN